MSYVKIWIHAVWTVKNRKPMLTPEVRQVLFDHIQQIALSKEILMEIVGGHNNHVHCLFRLRNNQTIENLMQLSKGESSFLKPGVPTTGLKRRCNKRNGYLNLKK